MSVRPPTRAQRIENERFLAALADTGNARLAARTLGLNRSTFTKRRARDAAFAQAWEAALAAAHARFHLGGGPRPAEAPGPRARGGEPVIVRRANGRLQLRLAQPGQVTRTGEQAVLRALAASANVRLSSAAAGLSHSTVYRRKRRSKAFARELRTALDMGYERLELAAIASCDPVTDPYDEWMDDSPPPLAQATVTEALQLLALHRNGVRLGWDEAHRRKRRNETHAQYGKRLFLMWRAEQRNLYEERGAARGAAYEREGSWRLPGDWPEAPPLPPLEQVTGWSKAKPKPVGSAPGKGLFGGWTIEDVKKRGSG